MSESNGVMAEILTAECGGQPEDYETDTELPPLEEYRGTEEGMDMSADDIPVEFEDINLEEVEEVGGEAF